MGTEPDFFSDWYLLTRTWTFIQKRLLRQVVWGFASLVRDNGIVLDVGCGRQPYRVLFPKSRYVGMEISAEAKPAVVGDARRIPIKDEVVDVVLCTEVIEHVYEFHQVLQEINRVLKKGGWLILTTPFSWGLHYEPNDYWRFTPYSLRRLLEERGFEVVKQVKIGGLFSLFGSWLVEGVALRLWRRDLKWLPPKIRHGMILIFSVPMSLVFYMTGNLLDRFISTDYIGNAVLARKANT